MPKSSGLDAYPSIRNEIEHRVAAGELTADPVQLDVAARLDTLLRAIASRREGAKSGALGWLLGRRTSEPPPRGLYLHGGVGRGKTMLMDLFFRMVPGQRKRRAHFNEFMADVHNRIGRHRAALKAGTVKGDDPIPPVAADIAREASLLCFDEFTVTDIADAMILSRLFSALFEKGVVLVATSNVAPDDLYRDGLNRALFLPFVDVLKRHVAVVPLDGVTDYRMLKLAALPIYMTPLGPDADRAMDEAWAAVAAGHVAAPQAVEVLGREVPVPLAAGAAARFSFADLCDAPLAARDYLALADRFDTFLIDGVPVLDQARRNATKRFILLIDTLYDRRRRLILSAEAQPDDLYAGRPGVTEAFEFARTASRLSEMRSAEWLADDGNAQR